TGGGRLVSEESVDRLGVAAVVEDMYELVQPRTARVIEGVVQPGSVDLLGGRFCHRESHRTSARKRLAAARRVLGRGPVGHQSPTTTRPPGAGKALSSPGST